VVEVVALVEKEILAMARELDEVLEEVQALAKALVVADEGLEVVVVVVEVVVLVEKEVLAMAREF
jgi:hypothetical protein